MFFLKDLPTPEMIERVTPPGAHISSSRVLDTLTKLRAASHLLREIEGFLRSRGLSQTQFLIMMMIYREPDRTSLAPSEIAARLDVSKPVLTRAFATLSDSGLVAESSEQPKDRRSRQLALTSKGRKAFEDLLPKYLDLLQNRQL